MTFNDFRRLEWEVTESGEIVTADPRNIPYIKEFYAVKDDAEKLRGFIEELGGEWLES